MRPIVLTNARVGLLFVLMTSALDKVAISPLPNQHQRGETLGVHMNKLRNLLFIQLFTGILIGLLMAVAALYMSSNLIKSEQLYHKELIQQFSYSNLIDDPKLLSKQLRASIDFEFLTLKDQDGNKLYSFNKDPKEFPLVRAILQRAELYTQPQSLVSDEGSLKIEFHSSYSDILSPLSVALLILLLMPVVIVLISFLLFHSMVQRIYAQVSERITQSILSFTKTKSNNVGVDTQDLPKQFEQLTQALNKLDAFFKNTLEEYESSTSALREEAHRDTLTQLPNRTEFVEHFENNIINSTQQADAFGILLLLRASELQHINQTKGYEDGDNYIKGIANIMLTIAGTYSNANVYRLNGSDFGILLPNVTVKEAETLGENLHSKLDEFMRITDISAVGSMGIVSYGAGKPLGELLANADTAISLAQAKQVNGWHIHKDSNISQGGATSFGNQNWRHLIDDVIEKQDVTLLFQPIQATNRGTKAYSEVLARFKSQDEQVLPTASFLAMAEKLDKVVDIDRLIVEKVLDMIKTKSLADQFFGVNLTAAAVHDEQFMIWLERRLLKETSIATKLIFEITEFGLQQNINSSRRFIDMVHRAGARMTVEKFGVGITSFKFFQELKPDFIKLDGSYTRSIEEEKNNQYFIRMIVDLSHRIGVNVIAECVETQEEKHVLEQLFVDGCQGYYLGKPAPL